MFPDDNVWNMPIDTLPVDSHSAAYITTIGSTTGVHPDFGTVYQGAPNGIPYVIVPQNQPLVAITFGYWDESDPGPYPIPVNPPIEGGSGSSGDRHVLILRQGDCKLFEIFHAYPQPGGTWTGTSGALWDLTSNSLRPNTWTSGDAAGLPMLPGLVRYEEVQAGEIRHALRFTCELTRNQHVWPARHHASSSTDSARPPMGQRFRLKSDVNIAGYPAEVQVILRALKKYGIILADNGGNWFISGVPNSSWNDGHLASISGIKGSDFEAVDESSMIVNADSGAAVLCTGDINGSGPCGVCPPDVVPRGGDGVVGVNDLLAVITTWGTCRP
jgi:hypothetical protein